MSTLSEASTAVLAAAAAGAMLAGGFLYSKTASPEPLKLDNVDYNNMSKALDEDGLVRTSLFEKETEINFGSHKNIQTSYNVFQCGMSKGENSKCLGYKETPSSEIIKWFSYKEVDQISIELGSGIVHLLDQMIGQTTKVGIFMRNCPEWVFIEQACTRFSMIPVPLYETLGEEACKYIINHVGMEVIFVDNRKKFDFLMKHCSSMPTLKHIVLKKKLDDMDVNEKNSIKIWTFQQVHDDGKQNLQPTKLPVKEDICTICFTSGTTGVPKGCVITHWTLVNSLSAAFLFTKAIELGKTEETHFSFLPLTHLYERLAHLLLFIVSGKIVFFSGEIPQLFDEMQKVKPTVLFSVPRLLSRLYDKVMLNINKNQLVKYLFNMGIESKSREIQKGIIRNNTIWDYMFFRRVQQLTGGQLNLIIVSSAPISESCLTFFRCVMGCLVVEGYGQTETCGPCTMTLPGDNESGQVGVPVPGVTVKLADVDELNIVASRDRRGEICVKGELGIKEYYNLPEMTKKLVDEDGWLHTGDVGLWTEKGQLKIVDRCKHIFKLAQGEYLAPERLENIYSLSPLIAQIFVTGNSFQDYCVAIVVPDLESWTEIFGQTKTTVSEICDDPESNKIILKEISDVGRKNGLMGFEIVKKVLLWPELMSADNDLITPTLKLKRAIAAKYFSRQVEDLYKK